LTVTVTYGGVSAGDSCVRLEVLTPSGSLLAGQSTTGTDGVITFFFTTAKKYGAGTYVATAYAAYAPCTTPQIWLETNTTTFTVS